MASRFSAVQPLSHSLSSSLPTAVFPSALPETPASHCLHLSPHTHEGFSLGPGHNNLLAAQFPALHLSASDMTKDQSLPASSHLSHLPPPPPLQFHWLPFTPMSTCPIMTLENAVHHSVPLSPFYEVFAFQQPALIHTAPARKAFLGIVGKQVSHSSGAQSSYYVSITPLVVPMRPCNRHCLRMGLFLFLLF